MPNVKFLQLILFVVIFSVASFFSLSFSTSAKTKNSESALTYSKINQTIESLDDGMYVVLGAFKIVDNAVQYAKSIAIDGKSVKIGKYEVNNLFYVYAYHSKEELEFVRTKRAELRAKSQFFDAWILYVGITLEELLAKGAPAASVEMELTEPAPLEIVEPINNEIQPATETNKEAYLFRFNVINAADLKEVPGSIEILDAARNKTMIKVNTNQIHSIKAPDSGTNEIVVLCDLFGFVKEQVVLKLDDPMSSPERAKISQEDGVTTVTFALSRPAKVGEKLTLDNVYFYTDAAIIKPESQSELNSLLSMLMENQNLEIRIHGHTNGKAAGKIISLKEDDDNYFKITDNNINGFGSAKKLSKRRAEIVMRWLMRKGIEQSRMEIKAWGGKKMIYKKNSFMAQKNIRVEIEIIKI